MSLYNSEKLLEQCVEFTLHPLFVLTFSTFHNREDLFWQEDRISTYPKHTNVYTFCFSSSFFIYENKGNQQKKSLHCFDTSMYFLEHTRSESQ